MFALWDLLKAAIDVLSAATEKTIAVYFNTLRRSIRNALILALALTPLPIVGVALKSRLAIFVYILVIGLVTVANLVLSMPLLMLGSLAFEKIGLLRKSFNSVLMVLLWFLLAALYFYVVPVWNNPALIIPVLVVFCILALASVVFTIKIINPRYLVPVMLLALGFMTRTFFFPQSSSTFTRLFVGFDGKLSRWIVKPRSVDPHLAEWFGPSGESLLWYAESAQCAFDFFDQGGFHPQRGVKLIEADRHVRERWEGCQRNAASISRGTERGQYSPSGALEESGTEIGRSRAEERKRAAETERSRREAIAEVERIMGSIVDRAADERPQLRDFLSGKHVVVVFQMGALRSAATIVKRLNNYGVNVSYTADTRLASLCPKGFVCFPTEHHESAQAIQSALVGIKELHRRNDKAFSDIVINLGS